VIFLSVNNEVNKFMSESTPNSSHHSDQEAGQDVRLDLAEKSIKRTGLYNDVKNNWNSIGILREVAEDLPASILMPSILKENIQYYEEYMQRYTNNESLYNYVIENSNPDKIREFDTLVGQANVLRAAALADLESGGKESAFYISQFLEVYDRAMILINSEL
jgi:hypothetical protein